MNRRASRAASLLASAAVLLGLAAASGTAPSATADDWSAPVTTTLTGTVVDENGWAIDGLEVDVMAVVPNQTGTTDASGRFTVTADLDHTQDLPVRVVDWLGVLPSHRLTATSVTPGSTVDLGTITVASTAHPGRASGAVRTTSRHAVVTAYRKRFRRQLRTEHVPAVHGCHPARTRTATKRRMLRATNYVRSMAGLSPVRLDAHLSRRAAKAALVQYRSGWLSHDPDRSTRCWTKAAARASARSNLSEGTVGAQTIAGYMTDQGVPDAGHRLWLLSPTLRRTGIGYAGTFNALMVMDDSGRRSSAQPLWVPWPSAGYFPDQLEPDGLWSFSTPRTDVSLRHAKVRLTVHGHRLTTHVHHTDAAYGYQSSMTWTVKHLPRAHGSRVVTVTVRITGAVLRGTTTLDPITYRVRLVHA